MRSTEDFDFPYVDMEIDENFNNEEAIKKYKKTRDNELREKIILNNMPLVLKIAKGYIVPSKLPVDDIISCGNIGLMNSIETYDIDGDTKFSTYAYNMITGDILNYITTEYGNGSRRFGFFIMKCRQYLHKLYGDKNYELDYQTLNEVLDKMIEDGVIEEFHKPMLIMGLTSMHPFNEITKEIEDIEWEEPEREVSLEHEYINSHLDYLLNGLTDEEKELVLYRYGFIDGKTYSLRKIAKMKGITHQAISLRNEKVLLKLKKKVKIIK